MAVVHLFCKVTPLADAEAITAAVQKAQAEGDQVRYANEYQKYQQELNKVHTETQEELEEVTQGVVQVLVVRRVQH